jgi:N-acetylmuramoyl-L-alanine amidase
MKKLYLFLFAIGIAFNTDAQIIVLDPGHGYGATAADNPDGRTATEIETALEVGLRTRTLIQGSCVWTVHMTRTTNLNSWISVTQRATMSNNWNADRLLSIHCNAGGGTGTETFYCTDSDPDPAPDIAFANKIQTDMVSYGSWNNRRCVEDNSYLAFHLGVLRYSSATACLNEIGFVDSADATKLTSSTWRDSFASGYYNALKSNLNDTCSATPVPGSFTLSLFPECSGTSSRIRLSWTTSANATSYDIYRNGAIYASNITGTTYTNTLVTVGTNYTYYVKAKNAGATQTTNTNGTLNATAINCTAPGSFTLTATPECSGTTSRINLTWTASANATSYDLYRNAVLYASDITGTQYLNTAVTPGTSYSYYVKAKNNIGTLNNSNGTLNATALTCPPGSFTLTVTPTCSGTTSAMNLTWTASVNATSYDIYRNGNLYASDVTGTSFLNTYLITPGNTYSYYMKAKNSAGTLNNSNGTISKVAISCSARLAAPDDNIIVVHPNPTSGIFHIGMEDVSDKTVDIAVYTVTGQLIHATRYQSQEEKSTKTIDISSFSSGLYFVKVTLDDREYTHRILKK